MMHRPTFTPAERAMIDRFRRELPEIIAGRDPHKPGITNGKHRLGDIEFETRICAQDGCNFYVFHDPYCNRHWTEHRAAERAAKAQKQSAGS